MQPPWKKLPPSFPATPSQSWGPVRPPLIENLVGGSSPLVERGGTHYGCFEGCWYPNAHYACSWWCLYYMLKLVSTIFYQIFVFHQIIALQKVWTIFFISSRGLFSFFILKIFIFFCFCLPLFFSLSAIALEADQR